MALAFRVLCRNNFNIRNITQPVKWNVQIKNYEIPTRITASGICYHIKTHKPLLVSDFRTFTPISFRECSVKEPPNPIKKQSVFQKLKQMYRDYWYVVVPVHLATSAIWFGSFYYAVRSGVDVIAILQALGVSESLIAPLKESSAGYFALALALYKLATPLRYAVTVGGTTYAIKKLTLIGWIKPVPSRERLKEMYQEKKDNFQDRFNESKQHYQSQMKEKRSQVMDEMRRYKTEMRIKKNKVKKM